jgi:hypothetical protein
MIPFGAKKNEEMRKIKVQSRERVKFHVYVYCFLKTSLLINVQVMYQQFLFISIQFDFPVGNKDFILQNGWCFAQCFVFRIKQFSKKYYSTIST